MTSDAAAARLDPGCVEGFLEGLRQPRPDPGSGGQATEGAVEAVADGGLGDAVPVGKSLLEGAGVAGLGGEGDLAGGREVGLREHLSVGIWASRSSLIALFTEK